MKERFDFEKLNNHLKMYKERKIIDSSKKLKKPTKIDLLYNKENKP